jgi:hypothetical protein
VRALVLVILVVSLGPVARALAQDPASQARAHFDRGVTLYDEGRLPQALAEFLEAQHIAPSSAFLYNVAQVQAELGHAVEAVDAYEELLRTATAMQASMRSQIETALTEQRGRIASLDVDATAPGALIALDDVEIGAAPLRSVRVSAGEHVVSARANGYESARYRFIVAGGATHAAHLTMTVSGAAVGSLRVDSRVPGVEVVVDGVSYGLTPLASAIPLPAGSHHVEGRRAAYSLFSQDATVAPGSESRTTLIVEPDPAAPPASLGTLRLAIPAASAVLRIDGAPAEAASAQQLSLPAGLHDVEVRVADREPYTTRIDMLAEQTHALSPPYAWTPEARERRRGAARFDSDLGLGLLIGGLATAVGGAVATIAVWVDYSNGQAHVTDAINTAACQNYTTGNPMAQMQCRTSLMQAGVTVNLVPAPDAPGGQLDQIRSHANSALQTYYAEIGIGAALAGIGGVLAIVGTVLLAGAPSDEAIDRSARAASDFRLELLGGPGNLTLRGTF